MARLNVEAVSEDTIAAPEVERPTNHIVASVTDPNGEPVTGLTAANFRIDPMISGNGAKVNVASVSAGRLPGVLPHQRGPRARRGPAPRHPRVRHRGVARHGQGPDPRHRRGGLTEKKSHAERQRSRGTDSVPLLLCFSA